MVLPTQTAGMPMRGRTAADILAPSMLNSMVSHLSGPKGHGTETMAKKKANQRCLVHAVPPKIWVMIKLPRNAEPAMIHIIMRQSGEDSAMK